MSSWSQYEFRHYTQKPFVLDRKRDYGKQICIKPQGLWLSTSDSWHRYCVGEQHESNKDPVFHPQFWNQVVLCDKANLLHVQDQDEMHDMTNKFCYFDGATVLISWLAVSQAYDGIVIAPHVEIGLDMKLCWYWGWDCACACIWDLSIVDRVSGSRLIRQEVL